MTSPCCPGAIALSLSVRQHFFVIFISEKKDSSDINDVDVQYLYLYEEDPYRYLIKKGRGNFDSLNKPIKYNKYYFLIELFIDFVEIKDMANYVKTKDMSQFLFN